MVVSTIRCSHTTRSCRRIQVSLPMHLIFGRLCPISCLHLSKHATLPNYWSSAQISTYLTESNELAGTSQSRQATNTGQPHRNQRRKINMTKKDIVCKYFGTTDGNYKVFFFWSQKHLGRPGPLDKTYFFLYPAGPERNLYWPLNVASCFAPCGAKQTLNSVPSDSCTFS